MTRFGPTFAADQNLRIGCIYKFLKYSRKENVFVAKQLFVGKNFHCFVHLLQWVREQTFLFVKFGTR